MLRSSDESILERYASVMTAITPLSNIQFGSIWVRIRYYPKAIIMLLNFEWVKLARICVVQVWVGLLAYCIRERLSALLHFQGKKSHVVRVL